MTPTELSQAAKILAKKWLGFSLFISTFALTK